MKHFIAYVILFGILAICMINPMANAEVSEVTEFIAEHFEAEYTYDCVKLDDSNTTNKDMILISGTTNEIYCMDKNSKFLECYTFTNAIDFANVATAIVTNYYNYDVIIIYNNATIEVDGLGTDLLFMLDVQRNINLTAMATLINAGGNV